MSDVSDIQHLADEGQTASQIAEATGLSRNAVIGRLWRSRLSPERLEAERRRKRVPRPALEDVKPVELGRGLGQIQRFAEPDRPGSTCQFIEGEPSRHAKKCGQPGYPYCPEHRARCYERLPQE